MNSGERTSVGTLALGHPSFSIESVSPHSFEVHNNSLYSTVYRYFNRLRARASLEFFYSRATNISRKFNEFKKNGLNASQMDVDKGSVQPKLQFQKNGLNASQMDVDVGSVQPKLICHPRCSKCTKGTD